MTDQYAVIGNPVDHSVSPAIHAAFARATGQDLEYTKLLAPLDGFAACVAAFRARGGSGINVTLPFKREAWTLVDAHGGYALAAAAVNTIDIREGRLIGYNTDGVGLVRDFRDNLGIEVKGRRVLLLGAGGATYGVMEPLLREGPGELVVANRTLAKAVAVAEHFRQFHHLAPAGVRAQAYAETTEGFDLIINATSAGLTGQMPDLSRAVFARGALAYDMVYGKRTPFLEFAAREGASVADGLGMLVEQAAESFRIWRGVLPGTAAVIAELRAQMLR